jgi:AraC-like DNA-binding protein
MMRGTVTKGGSISVQSVRGFLELARAQGLDVDKVLDEVGDPDLLDDFDGRVGWQICEKLVASISGKIGIAGMVRTMLAFRGSGFGVLYYVARNSKTVGLALRRVADHYHVTSTLARCELIEGPDVARLNLVQDDYLSREFRSLISALWSISNVTVVRKLVGDDFRPVEVAMEGPKPELESDLDAYSAVVRCPIRFLAPISSIALDGSLLDKQVSGADPVVEAAMLKYVAEVTAHLPNNGTAGEVRRIVFESLESGEPPIEVVARRLGTTARTLQRRLHEEGTSFHQVLDEVRREVAVTHMRGRAATIDEVAFLLGFEKPSSFHRAFKRWTGVTPGEFRRQGASG